MTLQALIQPLLDSLHTAGIKIGVFMFGLMLVIVGFWIVTQ